ncbi:MAG: alpha-hydroxy acid oxidase [Gemmatimonadetes bacterium]|nr:alpha-hydroxy acid oxidase [Gemmatimonadota bacterium]
MTLSQMPDWDRRAFLGFLAASPLAGGLPEVARTILAAPPQQQRALITEAGQALEVMDFEPVAREKLPPAHWGYIATGVDNEDTLRANREGFQRFALRARRLIDVSKVDMSTTIFGQQFDSPIFICPTGSNKLAHPLGEIAVSRAAKTKNSLQMLSTVATTSIEDAIAARGAPVWYQLYPPRDWEACKKMVKRAEAAGSPVLVITADLNPGSDRITLERGKLADTRKCETCHETSRGGSGGGTGDMKRKPMFDGLGPDMLPYTYPSVTWDLIQKLRDTVKMKLVVKGLATREDAELSLKHGLDGIHVSNHGGRADDGGRSSIESLPEIVAAVNGKIPVLFDSGVRRGTDVVKALALGANAVGIGRPYLWALAAFGQPGVEKVIDLLRAETLTAMRHIGATSVKGIPKSAVVAAGRS